MTSTSCGFGAPIGHGIDTELTRSLPFRGICSFAAASKAMARLTMRIDFESGMSIGPGKVSLLEAIQETGSIRRAAQRMQMGYRQAWLLLHALEDTVGQPLVVTLQGGKTGGGSSLTKAGALVVRRYREAERKAAAAARAELEGLESMLPSRGGTATNAHAWHGRLARKSLRR